MNPQPNIFNMIDQMSSVILTLQTDMIKVMNEINQLNLIITKIKEFKDNNNMNNINSVNNMMNMNNNLQNMQNMIMGMNNNMMGMQNMNMLMPMNGMMNNMNFPMQNLIIEDFDGWDLNFEKRNETGNQIITIRISPDKFAKEAISAYLLKSNETDRNSFTFIFNNHELFSEMKISQTGLTNGSKILVINVRDVKGG